MKGCFLFFSLLICRITVAQTPVSGVVKNSEGQPLHFAFVKDVKTKNAVYTDSLGNFTIQSAAQSFYINCLGYKDTVIAISGQTNLVISLKSGINTPALKNTTQQASSATDANIRQLSEAMTTDGGATQGTSLPQFNPKEETKGSRYFLQGWLHGFVIDSKDAMIQTPVYLFAYDKVNGGLLLTKDGKSAIEVNRNTVKAFTLYDNTNTVYIFENSPSVDPAHYVQVLGSGAKFKIYKAIKTTFEKANFKSDGVMTSGHNYDEYNDEFAYYVYDVQTGTAQKIALKKKAIKDAFAKDADKLNKFMTEHSSDTIDDFYLSALGGFMNE